MAKTKALISCAVTAQLICGFVFAYAKCWLSHAKSHFILASGSRIYAAAFFFFFFFNSVLHVLT